MDMTEGTPERKAQTGSNRICNALSLKYVRALRAIKFLGMDNPKVVDDGGH